MARPLSQEKRFALLHSATEVVAEQGVMATTSGISRRAGVAEGTFFTYFESKEALFQQLYLHLKGSLAEVMMPNYPRRASAQRCLEHIFRSYVNWGLENPVMRSAVARLSASGSVLEGARTKALEPFQEVYQMMQDAIRDQAIVDAPPEFLWAVIEGIADATIEYVSQHPPEAEHRCQLGFDMVWKAISV